MLTGSRRKREQKGRGAGGTGRRAKAPGPSAPHGGERRSALAGVPAWGLGVVALVIVVGYARTLGYPFHFDDFSNLRDNAALGPPLDLGALWAFRPSRFVLYLSFALNVLVAGPSPGSLRLVNLVIHFLTAMLAGVVAAGLTRCFGRRADPHGIEASARRVGVIAALLFAAHPLATQAVTYLIQRTASLAALLELGAVAFYLRARATRRLGSWIASWTLALLAAFTKEMSAALPLLVLALEGLLRARGDERERAPWIRIAPYAAVWPLLLASSRLPTAKLPAGLPGLAETSDIPRLTYLLTQVTVVPRYLALAVWPAGQNLDPAVALRPHMDGAVLLGALVLLAVTAAAIGLGRRHPLVLAGWVWCLLALLPESSLFPIRDVMVEHRMYLPLVGLAWILAALLAEVRDGRVRAAAVALLCVVLAGATYARNSVWRDEVALWRDVTAKSPDLPRGWNNLGMALDARGASAEAESCYRRALTLDQTDVYALVNLGRHLGIEGRMAESGAVLERAYRLAPDAPEVLNNLGLVRLAVGDSAGAEALWRHAVEVAPGEETPRRNLARLRAARGAGAARE